MFTFYIDSKGISNYLFKPNAKRRRSKVQIEEEKRNAEKEKALVQQKLA